MRGGGGGAPSPPARPTSHGHPLGENGDCALGHFLKAQHGGALGAPAVGTHPKEVAGLVGPARCLQHPPVGTQQPSPDMYGFLAAPTSVPMPQAVPGPCPYSSVQNSWLPLLPATDDTPKYTHPPHSPHHHQAIPECLTPDSQAYNHLCQYSGPMPIYNGLCHPGLSSWAHICLCEDHHVSLNPYLPHLGSRCQTPVLLETWSPRVTGHPTPKPSSHGCPAGYPPVPPPPPDPTPEVRPFLSCSRAGWPSSAHLSSRWGLLVNEHMPGPPQG